MWNKPEELVVGSNGQMYFAPLGTPLPQLGDDPTDDLDDDFIGAGLLTEDGFTPLIGSEVTDFKSWQALDPTRRERTGQEKSIAFSMQQWNQDNVPFAFGGGDVQDHGGSIFSYVFPEGDEPLDERSLVCDAIDGDKHYRFIFARGNVTEQVESQFQRGSESLLPVTFKVLRPEDNGRSAYFLTDDPAFAAGS